MIVFRTFLILVIASLIISCDEKSADQISVADTISSESKARHESPVDSNSIIELSIGDFFRDEKAPVAYYFDKKNNASAIDAAKPEMRAGFAGAGVSLSAAHAGRRTLTLVTLAETDGESDYRIIKNGDVVAQFRNPETETDYQEVEFETSEFELNAGDKIRVESNAVTNGTISEGDGTAFSRGRWVKLYIK